VKYILVLSVFDARARAIWHAGKAGVNSVEVCTVMGSGDGGNIAIAVAYVT